MASRLWPFLRLALIALAIWAAGYAGAGAVRSPAKPVLGTAAILAGFLAVTVAASVQLAVRRWRQRLSGRPILVALLCGFLLGLQTFESLANAERQHLWLFASFWFHPPRSEHPGVLARVRGGVGDVLLAANGAVTDYHWSESAWPKIAVFCAAQLAIGLLWAMRARELAVGAALFWVWAVAYFVFGLRTFGHYEGVSFWG